MTAHVFLADGFEEVEAITPIDFFVRAGMHVQRVGVTEQEITSNSGTRVIADCSFDDLVDPDPSSLLFLPGGSEGANNLSSHKPLIELLEKHAQLGGHVAAICIAPVRVLGQHGLLRNRRYTCYPGGEKELDDKTAVWVDEPIVRDENVFTSRGIGTAALFAAYLIRVLVGEEQAKKVWDQTLQGMSTPRFPQNI